MFLGCIVIHKRYLSILKSPKSKKKKAEKIKDENIFDQKPPYQYCNNIVGMIVTLTQ